MTVVGLQEIRLSVARAVGIGQYLIYAAAANARGQGGVELWILSSWVPKPREVLVLVASHRLLIVRVPMLVGIVQLSSRMRWAPRIPLRKFRSGGMAFGQRLVQF